MRFSRQTEKLLAPGCEYSVKLKADLRILRDIEESVMKFTKLVAGASLALTVSAFAPLAGAQTMGTNPSGGAAGTMPSGPGETGAAPSAGGAAGMNEGAGKTGTQAQQRATQVRNEIDQARNQGRDVKSAEAEQRRGERALAQGEEKTAMRHFDAAERELGMTNNGSSSPRD